MIIEETEFKGLKVLKPKVFGDERGYFMESYNQRTLEALDIAVPFIQDNEAYSKKGTVRGLHYQLPPYAQSKLVRVSLGEVLDVVVDIRPESDTFGKCYSIILSAENKLQLFVPAGFAHGYATLSEEALFLYKCDQYYSKEHESGIAFDDETLNIDWKVDRADMIVSDKDQHQPTFQEMLKQGGF